MRPIQNIARLEELWQARHREMEDQQGLRAHAEQILEMLKTHHAPTHAHSLRVALLADELMGMNGHRDTRPGFYGGTLHDEGKLAIAQALLSKTGRISRAEYDQLKEHAEIGHQSLATKFPKMALIAGAHHKLTTGGYGRHPDPELLHEPGMLTALHAVSIADYFDAAMTRRNVKRKQIEEEMHQVFPQHEKMVRQLLASRYTNEFYERRLRPRVPEDAHKGRPKPVERRGRKR